jgi:hypothetical protein
LVLSFFSFLFIPQLLDLSRLEKHSFIRIINLFPNSQDKNDFLEEKQLFSSFSTEGEETNSTSCSSSDNCFTWEEFCEFISNDCQVLVPITGNDSNHSSQNFFLMIDDLDVFDSIGRHSAHHSHGGGHSAPHHNNNNNSHSSSPPLTPIQLVSKCLSSVNEFDQRIFFRRETDFQKNYSFIVSFIGAAKQPTEVPLQFSDMNFLSRSSSAAEKTASQRFVNGPLHEEDKQPLISTYLKSR